MFLSLVRMWSLVEPAPPLWRRQSSRHGLKELDLGWNKVFGKAAHVLLVGLALNTRLNVSALVTRAALAPLTHHAVPLQTLDLSWNGLGKHRVDGQCGVVALLADYLATNKTLTHLDISHNRMVAADLPTLSEGLNKNHTLMGLHVAGERCASLSPHGGFSPLLCDVR